MSNYYPLSKTEEGIYVSCLQSTDAYNLAQVVKLDKNINIEKFKDAVRNVFSMHPYLFTILFLADDGNVYKKIKPIKLDIKTIEVDELKIESKS